MVRKIALLAALCSAFGSSSTARAEPLAIGEPTDVGARLPDVGPLTEWFVENGEALRSDYAVAAGEGGLLVAWREPGNLVCAALADPQGNITRARFELHRGTLQIDQLQAVFAGGRYVVVAGDIVDNLQVTRVITLSERGEVLGSFEYGGKAYEGLECGPWALRAVDGGRVVLGCDDGRISAIDLAGGRGETLLWLAGAQGVAPSLDCRAGSCVATGARHDEETLDRNVALVRFDRSGQLGALQMLGYRDAGQARIAVVQTAAGALTVTRSVIYPPGDAQGRMRERFHGFFVDRDSVAVRDIDPIAEGGGLRDPRLATNGASVALAYRTRQGPTEVVALSPLGEPRGEAGAVSTASTLDVRLAAMSSGGYVVAYDVGPKLFLRLVRLDPAVAPDAGAAGDAGADGGADATAGQAQSGTNDQDRSGGCRLGGVPTGARSYPIAVLFLAIGLGLLWRCGRDGRAAAIVGADRRCAGTAGRAARGSRSRRP